MSYSSSAADNSGAGKTTLLDVLADRKTTGVVTGDILMDGRKLDQAFQRGCAYAEQAGMLRHLAGEGKADS